MSTFQAVWPVQDNTMSFEELKAEAIQDLPEVAKRHRVRITGEPTATVRLGKDQPGAGETTLCVVVEAEAEPVQLVNPRVTSDKPVPCGRCGIERSPGAARYCTDCKPYAKADGWLEEAA